MFLFQITDNGETFSTLSKNPITRVNLGNGVVQTVKLFGDHFKLLKDSSESFHKTFTSAKVFGADIDVYSVDLDLLPDDNFTPITLFKRSFSTAQTFPAIVIFYEQEVSVISCYSLSVINIGSDPSNHICFDQLQPRHVSLYLQKGSITVATPQTVTVRVDAEVITGTSEAEYGSVVTLSDSLRLVVVDSKEILDEVLRVQTTSLPSSFTFTSESFPCIVANSTIIRPQQLPLKRDSVYTVGREPSNDIWVAAPHISRVHCVIRVDQDGETIEIEDQSTNGTVVNNKFLAKGQKIVLIRELGVIDLGKNLKLVICFSQADKEMFSQKGPKEREHVSNVSSSESISSEFSSKQLSAFKRRKLLVGIIILVMLLVGLLWSFLS